MRSEAIPEPINDYISDDDSDDDDTYIDDGVIAPVVEENREDDLTIFLLHCLMGRVTYPSYSYVALY